MTDNVQHFRLEEFLKNRKIFQPNNSKPVIDHEGREFSSIRMMCRYWHIDDATYRIRMTRGYSQEEALTIPPGGHRHE